MTYRIVATLLAATITTVVTVVALAADWATRPLLLCGWADGIAWIVLAVFATGERLGSRIDQVAVRIERAGDDRHADGVIEGMRRPAVTGLRGLN